MTLFEDWYGNGGKSPVNKNKKIGEWNFEGFFPRPKEEESKNYQLAESLKRIGSSNKKENLEKKVEVPSLNLSSYEKEGKFMLKNCLTDLTKEALDMYYEDSKNIDKCDILLQVTSDELIDMIDIRTRSTRNIVDLSSSDGMKEPMIYTYTRSDFTEISPKEAIFHEFDILTAKKDFCAYALIFQPHIERRIAVYQLRDDDFNILCAGAILIHPNGKPELVEFKKFDAEKL
ncbi:hypothetical protein HY837_02315 [archaeon]|nr:hypothetical protein [archaeon]